MPAHPSRARGSILVWAVLALFMVGSMVALAVTVGRGYAVRGGLQNGADAAALAGAAELTGQLSGIANGQQAAVALAGRHETDSGLAVTIDPASDVVFGAWDRATRLFTPIAGRTAADLRVINAVQVTGGREAARGNPLPVLFGGAFLDRTTLDVRATAIGVGGGPCSDECAFPAAFADCLLVGVDGALLCDDRLYTLNSDWQDNLGLTSLVPGVAASVPNIRAALGQCVESGADQQIPISNGNPLNPISNDPYFNRLPIEVSAPVVHVDRCDPAQYQKCTSTDPNVPCVNPKFVGDLGVSGYATFVICWVTGASAKNWPPPQWPTAECGPAPTLADYPGLDPNQFPDPFLKHTIFLKHRCYTEQPGNQSGVGGCGFFGTYTTRSRLVE